MIKAHKDDLAMVLLDLQMPLMNGMEVLKEMKGDSDLKGIPVIVLTADHSAEVECLRIGALDFIPKPYPSSEVILARVNRCIELSENRIIIQSTERESLTKLLNLDYFIHYVRVHDLHFSNVTMDAIVIDINSFHGIRERCGKQYSDKLLTGIGEHIREIAREIDGLGCHSSEDTFFIYCPHQDDYKRLLEKVCEDLQEKDPSGTKIELRMGVYPKVDKKVQIERRFAYAEAAADVVKNDGHKAIGVYE
jgi:PleD family two-component response regulator